MSTGEPAPDPGSERTDPPDGDSGADGAGAGPGGLSHPTSALGWVARYGRSLLESRHYRRHLGAVERFCFFVGYPRSGHSLVGSLLNAHPEILIAHELDAVGYVEHHFGRAQVFALLVQRDQEFATMGRQWMGYDYVVPGQFQGRWTTLKVVGDKRARTATYRLAHDDSLLDRIRTVVGVPLRVVHVTRNPYDNITTMARRMAGARRQGIAPGAVKPVADIGEAIDRYAPLCQAVADLRPRLAPDELHEIAYEEFVGRPGPCLAALCAFLGVPADDAYIAACAAIVWPQTRATRQAVEWSDADKRRVEDLIGRYPFLARYSWDS